MMAHNTVCQTADVLNGHAAAANGPLLKSATPTWTSAAGQEPLSPISILAIQRGDGAEQSKMNGTAPLAVSHTQAPTMTINTDVVPMDGNRGTHMAPNHSPDSVSGMQVKQWTALDQEQEFVLAAFYGDARRFIHVEN